VNIAQRSFLPLPCDAGVSAGAETDVTVAQGGELGDPQAGLDHHQQECVVASAEPRVAVRCREQRLDLLLVEVADRRALVALGRDLDHPRECLGVLRVPQ